MERTSRKALSLIWLVAVGCSGGSGGGPAPAPVTLSVSPSSYTFALDDNAPVTVTVTRTGGPFASLALGVADPTIVGVTPLTLSGSAATFSVIPVARGATAVTAVDGSGASASFSVTTASCGRPATLVAAQQFVPAAGATAVAPSIGKMYFVGYFVNGVRAGGKLHLIVGAHGTQEGGPLVQATPPPGTVLPTPIPLPGVTDTVLSATVPALVAGQSYQTQLYNDTCQPAVLAGAFST